MLQRVTVTVQVLFEDEQAMLTIIADALEVAARRAGAHDATAASGGWASAGCVTCSADMTLTDVDVAHHLDVDGNLDHDLDADHVALAPAGCYA